MKALPHEWWKSMSVWSGLLASLLGFYLGIDHAFEGILPHLPGWLYMVLSAIFGITVVAGRVQVHGKPYPQ